VTRWFRWSLSVADPFVYRCLTSPTMLPFLHPAHRTGRVDLPHPALGEDSLSYPLSPLRVDGRKCGGNSGGKIGLHADLDAP